MINGVTIDFTEEMVLNNSSLPKGMKDFRYYRAEIWSDKDQHYAHEFGGLWLPKHVDICLIEDFINERIKES